MIPWSRFWVTHDLRDHIFVDRSHNVMNLLGHLLTRLHHVVSKILGQWVSPVQAQLFWKEVARSDTWMVMGWKTCFTGMAGSDQPPEVLEQSAAALASEHCDKKKKLAGPAWGVERFTTPNLTHQGLCSPKVAPPTNTDKTSAWAKGGRTFQKRSQQRHGSRQQGERELGLWMSHQCWIGN